MISSRYPVAALAVAVLAVTAGCSGGVLGEDGPIEASASPATISGAALQEAGFEEAETREVEINRTVTVNEQEREIRITNHVAGYRATGDGDRAGAAAVTVLSTPRAETFGVPLNPVASMSIGDAVSFAAEAGGQFDGSIDTVEEVDSWETTVLGEETTVTKFATTVERDGQQLDLFVHATKVTHGDDIVVVVAVYPQALEGEVVDRQQLTPLFEGVQHRTEES